MELLQLKYFARLAHNEHLTKTANEVYVTPSAVSTSIVRLDGELGVLASEKNKARTNISVAVRAPVLWLPIFNDFRNGIHKFSIMTKSYWECL